MSKKYFVRRQFLQLLAQGGLGMSVLSKAYGNRPLPAASFSPNFNANYLALLNKHKTQFVQRDRYGGCPDVSFEPSGFFRLEKSDRWWLVTPEGNAFFSWGLNHVFPHLLHQSYNYQYWRKQFGMNAEVENPGFSIGDWINRLRENPEDPFIHKFIQKAKQDLDLLKINTLGVHSWSPEPADGFIPYIISIPFVPIAHSRNNLTAADFHDVFADDFRTRCRRLVDKHVVPRKEDPFLIGYAYTDCPILTQEDAAPRLKTVYGKPRRGLPTCPLVLRNLGNKAPGKQAYVSWASESYDNDIQAFNQTYDTYFDSFEALQHTEEWRPVVDPRNEREQQDLRAFLEKVVEQYYAVTVAAIREKDPNHLILGDKLNGNTYLPDGIAALAGKYMDLIFYQTYGYYDEQAPDLDRWSRISAKPLFNGDSAFSVPEPMMPHPFGPHCQDQNERAERSLEFAVQACARPDFVGWNFCGWMDGWKAIAGKEVCQHSGLQDPRGNIYAPMQRAFQAFSHNMYDIANGKLTI